MSIELAKIGFYVVAFFIVIIFVRMLIDKAKELRESTSGGGKKKEDPFK